MASSPYAIGATSLNFGGMGAGSCFMSNPAKAYSCAYNNYLSLNKQNYNNIVNGYNQLASAQFNQEQAITAGYTGLQNAVYGTIQNICKSQMQRVQCTYTKQMANSQQQAINAGLGNSTVLQSMQRGVTQCEAMAQTAVQNQFAALKAGYMSNLGLATLNYQNQANMQNAALGAQELNTLASIQIPPPCANSFAQMYNANRAFGLGMMGRHTTMPPPNMGGGLGAGTPPRSGLPCFSGYGGGGGGGIYGTDFCRPPGPVCYGAGFSPNTPLSSLSPYAPGASSVGPWAPDYGAPASTNLVYPMAGEGFGSNTYGGGGGGGGDSGGD